MAEVATPAPAATPTPTTPAATPAPVVNPIEVELKRTKLAHNNALRERSEAQRQMESLKKTYAEKEAKLTALEKREAMAKLDPPSYLKSLYGDDWSKTLNEMVANGGAPPAQLIAAEMQKLRDEMDAKYKARDDEAAKAAEAQKSQAVEQARRSIFAESAEWYRQKAAEFPILARLGEPPAVARIISQRIEAEFHKSVDAEGNGKVLTTAEAAELIEAEVLDWAREAGKHEKYKAKLQPPADSSTVPASGQSQQGTKPQDVKPKSRRTVSTDITGTTQAAKPPVSDAERRARAIAASQAVMKR